MNIGEMIITIIFFVLIGGAIIWGIVLSAKENIETERRKAENKRREEEKKKQEEEKNRRELAEFKQTFPREIQECEEMRTLLVDATESIRENVAREVSKSLIEHKAVNINYYTMKLDYFCLDTSLVIELTATFYNDVLDWYENMTEEEVLQIKKNLLALFPTLNKKVTLSELCKEYLKPLYISCCTKDLIEIIQSVNEQTRREFDEYIIQHPEAYQIARQNELLTQQNLIIEQQTAQISQYNKDIQDAIDRQARNQAFSTAALGLAIMNN